MRKTKIVCTLGPATDDYETLKSLVKAGLNVARLNMSHGDHAEHLRRIEAVRKVRAELGVPVALLMDTKGPEIRVKTFINHRITLVEGARFTLTSRDIAGDESIASVTYSALPSVLKKGDRVLLNDGMIELTVEKISGEDVVTTVVNGGELTDRKSINLPGIEIDMPYLSAADKSDIEFAVRENADYIALSFVRRRKTGEKPREKVRRRGHTAYFQNREPSGRDQYRGDTRAQRRHNGCSRRYGRGDTLRGASSHSEEPDKAVLSRRQKGNHRHADA